MKYLDAYEITDLNEGLKSVTVLWLDDLAPESFKLVTPKYHLKSVKARVDSNEKPRMLLTVVGKLKDVKSFLDDFDDDSFEILDNISIACKTDEEYVAAVRKEIEKIA